MPADPARLAAITARLAEWPEATLTPVVVRDELATDDSESVRWPCLRHEEEAHVAFEFQRGEVTGQRETATPQGSVIEATVEVRQALAFCANCSPTLAEAIAAAPSDIRYLLAQLAAARGRAERAEGALEPFAHPDLLKMTGGQCQGDDSPVYGRDRAVLKLGHFRAAARALAARGE